ncbi:Ribosomal protein L7/L12, C-terminal/adaptor protein ClpS-like [Pseudocohnilembus persalinus]|uniref:Ribosomal protein L7/L12, C-terminal/adaptor protein ClpS-like n=1 Tax=Pseudocohnilembus persalinus TaxID=266149 RepID=A0A0V0Q9C9_PSEPJ|nr:Ribosomal protein L7/L12, C-terminal/adaptor protein ClpS-like [Pseudocohnilembus persalinus]|eukprot:KRW98850.1 Ribosomal protein L7/L12, C-terminal/adaptor protein ClpS-like [Pseudocohnilembus persalinus]
MIAQRLARQIILNSKQTNKVTRVFCSNQQEQKVHDFKDKHQVTEEQLKSDKDSADMAAKFQREWEQIAQAKDKQQIQTLTEELSEDQRKKVDLIAKAMLDLNVFESRYLTISLKENIYKSTNIDLMKLNIDWPGIKQLESGSWPPNNPNWFLQQEAIAKLWPTGQQGMSELFGNVFGGAVSAGGAAAQQGAQGGAQEAKEEKKEEAVKTAFNVELAKFDAATKIKVIKEVRTVLGLGLKEAKELVEKAPTVVKQNIGKAEAEELKEKLEKAGCTINLL